jgi:hypothetical protein
MRDPPGREVRRVALLPLSLKRAELIGRGPARCGVPRPGPTDDERRWFFRVQSSHPSHDRGRRGRCLPRHGRGRGREGRGRRAGQTRQARGARATSTAAAPLDRRSREGDPARPTPERPDPPGRSQHGDARGDRPPASRGATPPRSRTIAPTGASTSSTTTPGLPSGGTGDPAASTRSWIDRAFLFSGRCRVRSATASSGSMDRTPARK